MSLVCPVQRAELELLTHIPITLLFRLFLGFFFFEWLVFLLFRMFATSDKPKNQCDMVTLECIEFKRLSASLGWEHSSWRTLHRGAEKPPDSHPLPPFGFKNIVLK